MPALHLQLFVIASEALHRMVFRAKRGNLNYLWFYATPSFLDCFV